MYYDENLRKLTSIDIDIVKPRWYSRNHIKLKHRVLYRDKELKYPTLIIEPGLYDGFSVPRVVTWVTGGLASPLMPVWESTLPHDAVCSLDDSQWTSRMKRELFEDAYVAAINQFYDGKRPDKLSSAIIKSVRWGSKYLGFCK